MGIVNGFGLYPPSIFFSVDSHAREADRSWLNSSVVDPSRDSGRIFLRFIGRCRVTYINRTMPPWQGNV